MRQIFLFPSRDGERDVFHLFFLSFIFLFACRYVVALDAIARLWKVARSETGKDPAVLGLELLDFAIEALGCAGIKQLCK